MNSNQSHKSYREYKSENGCTQTLYQRWDQVPWRSKHPMMTDHTRCEHYFHFRYTEQTVVKISVSTLSQTDKCDSSIKVDGHGYVKKCDFNIEYTYSI
jgi:hypothetical protein